MAESRPGSDVREASGESDATAAVSHELLMSALSMRLAVSGKSKLMTKDKYERIVSFLLDPATCTDAHLRHWVKVRRFSLVDLPMYNLQNVLMIPRRDRKGDVARQDGDLMRVVHQDELYSVVNFVHSVHLVHAGYKKVLARIEQEYYGISREYVQEFCKTCPICELRKPKTVHEPLRPIIASGVWQRIQVDLIDMRHSPDGEYCYIGHVMDHFSKFHILFPLKTKSATEVAANIEERVFAYFGVPRIFHSDNGREFVNQFLQALFVRWGGNTVFVSGRPRHSQSQGCVERGNRYVQDKIAAMKYVEGLNSTDIHPWGSWLPRICHALNTEVHTATKEAPFRMLFGQDSRSDFVVHGMSGVVTEEELDDVAHVTEEHISDVGDTRSNPLAMTDVCFQVPAASAADSLSAAVAMCDVCVQPCEATAGVECPENPLHAIRKRARFHYVAAAERMKHVYDASHKANIHHFTVGDAVALAIPQADRSSTDMRRLPCRVVAVSGEVRKGYKLMCCYGILSRMFCAGDLSPFHGDVGIPDEARRQVVSLREAARKTASSTRFTCNKCNCFGDCRSRKCSCVVNGISCSNHCHPQHRCMNADAMSDDYSELLSFSAMTEADVADVLQGRSLSDNVMCTVSSLLQDFIQAAHRDQLECGESYSTPVLQILHWSSKQHWITVSNVGCRTIGRSVINVYDSKMYEADTALHSMLAALLRSPADELTINHMHVQHQANNTDCGLFAIAFACALAFGQDPTALRFSPAVIRPLILKQLQARTLQAFPSSVIPPRRPVLRTTLLRLYCVCRMPDDGREMVQCDRCDSWFHVSCVALVNRRGDWYCRRCVVV